MNAETHNPTAAATRIRSEVAPAGLDAVARSFVSLNLLPLHAVTESRNQSIPSLVHHITGLSKARISKGNLDAIRPSTKKKIEQHMERMLQEQFAGSSKDLDDFKAKIDGAPVTSSGEAASLAGWIHHFEVLPWVPLPMTKVVALTIDELVEALLTCCRNDDLPGFKQRLLAHLQRHGWCVRSEGGLPVEPVPDADLLKLRAATDWEQVADLTRDLPERLYWDVVSSLDAEWNTHYFSNRQTLPLYPLVMVRAQKGLLETMKVRSRRNIIFKPVRRLLEFLYALAFFLRYKRWPAKAPTPKTLAGILYRPDKDELAEESLINNYFDGTTKLTLDLVMTHWDQLLDHFIPSRPATGRLNPPLPMIILALQWQTLLVRDRGRSFLIPDMKMYETLWSHRRKQSKLMHTQGTSTPGQLEGDPINWPVWSLNQPSSLS